MQQILWFEIAFKSAIGLALFLFPMTLLRIVGLQRPETGFWPRLVGGLVLGIAAAALISVRFSTANGVIGAAGLIPINLAGAAGMIVPLIMGTAAPTRRGRVIILVNAVVLLVLAFLEISHI